MKNYKTCENCDINDFDKIENFTEKYIDANLEFLEKQDWITICRKNFLNNERLEKYKDEICWDYVIRFYPLEFSQIKKYYHDYIDYQILKYQILDTKSLNFLLNEEIKNKFKISEFWQTLSKYISLTKKQIDIYSEYFIKYDCLENICQYQKLTKKQIIKFAPYFRTDDWYMVIKYQD